MADEKNGQKKLTKVQIDYDGDVYTIEYNKDSIRLLEQQYDFNIEDLSKYKLSKLPDLFYCGFKMHHPDLKRRDADRIFALVGDKDDLFSVLMDLYQEAMNSIFEEPEQGKALSWKAI